MLVFNPPRMDALYAEEAPSTTAEKEIKMTETPAADEQFDDTHINHLTGKVTERDDRVAVVETKIGNGGPDKEGAEKPTHTRSNSSPDITEFM